MFWRADLVEPTGAIQTVPAPIGGLNARDSLAAMPTTDASVLDNWWPQPYGVSVRKGYSRWVTGLPSSVETLAAWSGITGTQKLFAWSGTALYDCTTAGVVGAPVVSGLATARWDTVNVVNSAGSFLIALTGNGVDSAIKYDGATYARIVAGDGIVVNTWAGINPINARNPTVHQRRLWVVQKDSTLGWYLPPDAIQGTFVSFNFGSLFSRGGFLQFLCTWTLDDGNGAEDHLIAVSSRGEAVVFGGTNPSSDTTWSLQGVYFIGAPVEGSRNFTKAAGDVLIVTQQGVVSMTASLASTKVNEAELRVTSAKIQFLISDFTTQFGTLFGWELRYFPRFNMLLVNVPNGTSPNTQLAANQLTNAWATFSGVAALCWTTLGSAPFFGAGDGIVYSFWSGSKDGALADGTGGTGIVASVLQAYSYLGSAAAQKQVSMYRPSFLVGSLVAVNSTVAYDFTTPSLTTPTLVSAASGALWDSAIWDSAIWSGGTAPQRNWYSAEGMGVAAALRMITVSDNTVLWVSTDYVVQKGLGVL